VADLSRPGAEVRPLTADRETWVPRVGNATRSGGSQPRRASAQASVVELRRVQKLTDASSHVFIVFEGEDTALLRAYGDAVVPRLRDVGAPWVTSADDGIQGPRAYLKPRLQRKFKGDRHSLSHWGAVRWLGIRFLPRPNLSRARSECPDRENQGRK